MRFGNLEQQNQWDLMREIKVKSKELEADNVSKSKGLGQPLKSKVFGREQDGICCNRNQNRVRSSSSRNSIFCQIFWIEIKGEQYLSVWRLNGGFECTRDWIEKGEQVFECMRNWMRILRNEEVESREEVWGHEKVESRSIWKHEGIESWFLNVCRDCNLSNLFVNLRFFLKKS